MPADEVKPALDTAAVGAKLAGLFGGVYARTGDEVFTLEAITVYELASARNIPVHRVTDWIPYDNDTFTPKTEH